MKASRRMSWAGALSAAIIAIFAAPHCSASSFIATPPPNPSASCASADYAADEKVNLTQQTPGSDSSTVEVVLGDKAHHLNTSEQIEMGRQVTVCIKGLYNWIYVQKNHPADLRLFIGGQILSNVAPSSLSPPGQEYVDFTLSINSADSADWAAWAAIVNAARHGLNEHKLTISVAQNSQVFASDAVTTIKPYPDYWYYLVGAFVLLLAVLAYLASRTSLLRSTIGGSSDPLQAPFSLALVQMAFWFYLAVAAYVYICVSTLQIHIPMGSVLGLLGISATTGLAAIAVDSRKHFSAKNQKAALLTEQAALNSRVKDLSSTPPAPGSAAEKELIDIKKRLAHVDALVAQQSIATPAPSSNGFFQDILSDGDGISFHRFQIAVWTLVLGSVFVWAVYRNMTMPEFDASLLTLMGISAGTYVGFKFPETPKT